MLLTMMTEKLTVSKLVEIEGTFKTQYQDSTTQYDCAPAQGLTPEETQLYEGQISNLESRFVEITCPAQISDLVKISGKSYKCRGVKSQQSSFGSIKFKKLILASVDGYQDTNQESSSS